MRLSLALLLFAPALSSAAPRFEVTFAASTRSAPVDGRLIVVISKNPALEPRFQIGMSPDTQQIFAIDIDDWKPGTIATIDASAMGHPLRSLRDLPPGGYRVQ